MTKAIQIFRSGTHTDASGNKIIISNDDIDTMIANYNESNKAPLVIGHPTTNAPAFGWANKLSRKDDILYASFSDVHEDIKQAVTDKHYQKVSTSFYTPQHPHNPTQGSWYPRHVGLLGATPPAIKGLETVAFSETDNDCLTVEFAEVSEWALMPLLRNIRDYFVEELGREKAEQIMPSHQLDHIIKETPDNNINFSESDAEINIKGDATSLLADEGSAHQLATTPLNNPPASPNINNSNLNEKDNSMTDEQKAALEAREAQLKKQEDALAKSTADFSENMRTTTLEATKGNLAGLRDAGKISPAAYDKVAEFAENLSKIVTVDFSESDATNPVADFGKFIAEFAETMQAGTAPAGEASASDGTADFSEADKQSALITHTQKLMAENPALSSAQAATQAAKEIK